ncbi:DNA-binding GntR family transcriptional regulator [Aequitasia blattaphilus]|uniref:GntR family transcriptional regulator n=1 Tax=Aequitasia blattaphilus TaxID=2949332 RepID=A0ABT1EAM2_9FIRM|nr:GntR family transcriptional regulator [Aequitasia blattaphilus]MCP1102880.1 GntR family transcriptional regulator [Aequitasia blattaphilus]MCR8615520.1 GntR family transcriptional regulator [Aequitasia blattaphilus]
MIRRCTNKDVDKLMKYLEEEEAYKRFLVANMEENGLDSSMQKVYIDDDTGIIKGVYLCYYKNLMVYSKDNTVNQEFLKDLFVETRFDLIWGKTKTMVKIGEEYKEYTLFTDSIYPLTKTKLLMSDCKSTRRAIFRFIEEHNESKVSEEEDSWAALIYEKRVNEKASYLSIYNWLREDIVSGQYQTGSRLPSENILSDKYNVSRNTVRQALTVLNQDGYIEKKQGKGTYVVYNQETKEKGKFYNYLFEDVLEEITDVESNPKIIRGDKQSRFILGLKEEEKLIESQVVCWNYDKAIGMACVQVPVSILSMSGVDIESKDEIDTFITRNLYYRINESDFTIEARKPTKDSAHLLNPGKDSCVLYMEQVAYDSNQRIIGRIRYYFLSDKYCIQYRR